MHSSECFRTLQKANPRARDGFLESVEAVGEIVRGQIGTTAVGGPVTCHRRTGALLPRRRLAGISAAGVMLAGLVAVAVLFTVGSHAGGPGGRERSCCSQAGRGRHSGVCRALRYRGRSVAPMDGGIWAGTTIRWYGADLAVSRDTRGRPAKAGSGAPGRRRDDVRPRRTWPRLGGARPTRERRPGQRYDPWRVPCGRAGRRRRRDPAKDRRRPGRPDPRRGSRDGCDRLPWHCRRRAGGPESPASRKVRRSGPSPSATSPTARRQIRSPASTRRSPSAPTASFARSP